MTFFTQLNIKITKNGIAPIHSRSFHISCFFQKFMTLTLPKFHVLYYDFLHWKLCSRFKLWHWMGIVVINQLQVANDVETDWQSIIPIWFTPSLPPVKPHSLYQRWGYTISWSNYTLLLFTKTSIGTLFVIFTAFTNWLLYCLFIPFFKVDPRKRKCKTV